MAACLGIRSSIRHSFSVNCACLEQGRQGIPRLHRVCTLCAGGNPGDEQHVVFECPGLQDIRDRYQGLFGEHAATMLHFMWQDDIRGVAMFIKECLEVYYGTDPDGGQASDQPWVVGKDVKFLSLSPSMVCNCCIRLCVARYLVAACH